MTDVADHSGESYGKRKQSVYPRDSDGMMTGPSIRRMSRLEPRPSVQYGMARRMSHVSRSSMSGASLGLRDFKPPMQVANTYRMAPNSEERFQSKKAEEVIKQVLQSFLEGEKYNPNIKNICTQISEVITGRIKGLGFSPRYKLVCWVNIGQNRNQGVAAASRSVWNTETDNYATASHTTQDLFAVACVFATYFE